MEGVGCSMTDMGAGAEVAAQPPASKTDPNSRHDENLMESGIAATSK